MNIFKKTSIKILLLVIPCLILAGAILVGRVLWFREGLYSAPEITEIEVGAVPTANYQPITDKPVEGKGHVVIDLSHNNSLLVDDLSPLRDRLEARGATVETLTGSGSLETSLHKATALVVAAPAYRYMASEREAVVEFVEDGGLLLLIADPTRPASMADPNDPYHSPYDALYPISAVPAINSLANAFGVVYYDDYLYNLEENAGSYRNVQFTNFGKSSLTKNLETVVFFVAHSLSSDGTALIVGDENTISPVRSGESGLAAAMLSSDERVLALGDLTFMIAPYQTVEDNDQFLSNIADWLSADKRQRDDLDDFPYLFKRPVGVVQAEGETLDPRLIVRSSEWQVSLEQAGLTLNLGAEADPDHDVIFVSTFEDTEAVEEYLASGGITLTVTTEEEEGEEKLTGSIEIEGMGTVAVEGTSLFLIDRSEERLVIVVMAEDMEKTIDAAGRLFDGNFSGCVRADAVTVCSTGEAPKEPEEKEEPPEEGTVTPPAAGSIFIVANDNKAEGARTGVPELEDILSGPYDVTTWYTSRDGIPTASDVAGYDAYIIDSGDYATDMSDLDVFASFEDIETKGVMFIGAQPLPIFTEFEPIDDLQVADTTHPLAAGFKPGEVFVLSVSESGVPAVFMPESESDLTDDTSIVFKRGPGSSSPGGTVVLASYDPSLDMRIIFAFFSFYRLPGYAQPTFALNAAAWLTGAE
jgi:hypothetical protein